MISVWNSSQFEYFRPIVVCQLRGHLRKRLIKQRSEKEKIQCTKEWREKHFCLSACLSNIEITWTFWIVVLDLSFFSFAFSYMLLHESGYSCYSIKVPVSNGFMRINNDTHNEDINVPRYYPIAFFKKIFLLILLCECMCLCTWLQVPVEAKKGSCNLLRLGLCELPYKGAENQTWILCKNSNSELLSHLSNPCFFFPCNLFWFFFPNVHDLVYRSMKKDNRLP